MVFFRENPPNISPWFSSVKMGGKPMFFLEFSNGFPMVSYVAARLVHDIEVMQALGALPARGRRSCRAPKVGMGDRGWGWVG